MLEFGLIKYLSPLDDEEVSFLAAFLRPESLNRINIHKNKEERDILVADECHILVDPNIPQTLEYLRNK